MISKIPFTIFCRSKSTCHIENARKFNLVKEKFEVFNKLLPETYIIVCLDGVNFKKFCTVNSFEKPVDLRNVNLMNSCALKLMKQYSNDIVCAYGFSDEFNFILKPNSEILRRNSKYFTKNNSFLVHLYSFIQKK